MKPLRVPLFEFPDVVLHADELLLKRNVFYPAAKGGNVGAAANLVAAQSNLDAVRCLASLIAGRTAELLPIHALESEGVNEIPTAFAHSLAGRLGLSVNRSVVQTNSVGHTGASGFHRLAHQALFGGEVKAAHAYVIVDDFVGQGGTLANLVGYICAQGGVVIAATVLTGKPYSVKLAPDKALLQALRHKHGRDIEDWWQQHFGFGFDCLTRSEARYLEKSADADTIRNRLVAAGLASGA
jgi:hypoxanthine-guanine phosphoribosyltransferase